MLWRVDNEVIEILEFTNDERTDLFKRFHSEKRNDIECLCLPPSASHPTLHIRKTITNKYVAVNNKSNLKHNMVHAEDCIYNTKFKGHLKSKGIEILDDGTIECSLKNFKKQKSVKSEQETSSIEKTERIGSSYSRPKAALRYLFYFLFQKNSAHIYKPNQQRNLHKRLYRSLCETILDKEKLTDKGLVVSNKSYYDYRKHILIIGWGKKSQPKLQGNFYVVDMYSLDDKQTIKYQHKIYSSVYKKATFTRAGVDHGYWVIYRAPKEDGKLAEKEIIFVPAEEESMIPVDSSYEKTMINHLIKSKCYFKRPLVMSIDEDLLPDFILNKNEDTILEVAGLKGDPIYDERLKEKEEHYKKSGLKYLEWIPKQQDINEILAMIK